MSSEEKRSAVSQVAKMATQSQPMQLTTLVSVLVVGYNGLEAWNEIERGFETLTTSVVSLTEQVDKLEQQVSGNRQQLGADIRALTDLHARDTAELHKRIDLLVACVREQKGCDAL